MSRMFEYETYMVKLAVNEPDYKAATSPDVAGNIVKAIYDNLDQSQEHLGVLFLNSKMNCFGFKTNFAGTMNACNVDVRLIFSGALTMNAHALVIYHNHPSGNPEFSSEDYQLTKRLVEIGILLNIPVVDHILYYRGDTRSLRTTDATIFEGRNQW